MLSLRVDYLSAKTYMYILDNRSFAGLSSTVSGSYKIEGFPKDTR